MEQVSTAVGDPHRGQEESLLTFGVTGSEGGSGYSLIMSRRAVQKALLEVARAPKGAELLREMLEDAGVDLQDLERLKLVRRQGGEYVISFPLFTREDVRKVRAAAENAAGSLVDVLLAHRAPIDDALQNYEAKKVDRKALAFIVIGCFSLDWDGLDLTAERGYRSLPEVTADSAFMPWAEEKSELSLRGIYWGSHNACEGDLCFTTFGDHFSLPRYALPDLLWHGQFPPHLAREVPDESKPALERVKHMPASHLLRHAGDIMFALRDGPKTLEELAHFVGVATEAARALLTLLGGLEYAGKGEEHFHALAPVLSERDGALVRQLRRIGWESVDAWLQNSYDELKAQLSDLTAARYGVPFPVMFTQIWHYVFGTANRRLVEAGMFVDPYAPSRRYKGFVPVVWHQSLRHLR